MDYNKDQVSGSETQVKDTGWSYRSIWHYTFPEIITALVFTVLVPLVDVKFIAHLKSTAAYATVSVTNTLCFLLMKVAEGLMVGTIILVSQHHGKKQFEAIGKVVVAALWATTLTGFIVAIVLFSQADFIYRLLCVPQEMVVIGVPLLRLRAISIFLMFVFYGLVGFLRGVKNTKAAMYCFVLGAITFFFFDYALIFGSFGFPAMRVQGSAMASIIQYVVMIGFAVVYISFNKEYRQYAIRFLCRGCWAISRTIFSLSWPVMFDKAAQQAEKTWIIRLIGPLGTCALGSLSVINDMERLAFIPAMALGQVVTVLSGSDCGLGNYEGIKQTVKRCLLLGLLMVMGIFVIFSFNAYDIVSIFDKEHTFTDFAARAFPIVSMLICFDVLQIILAGALRGTSNVRVVMWVRVLGAVALLAPLSYGISLLPISNPLVKFIMIYGTYNLVNGISSAIYYYWFHSNRWHNHTQTSEK